MGNRVFILLFLVAALSLLFTAASAAVLAVRKKQGLRLGIAAWAVLFVLVTVPFAASGACFDLILHGDWTGGMRIEILSRGRELAEVYLSAPVLTAARMTAGTLSAVWLAAAAASFSYGISSYFNNVHFLTKRSRVCRDERANTVFEAARKKAGVRRHVPLRIMDYGLKISPCTCGLLSSSVFVGVDYLRDYSDERLELVFLHELTHVKHCDSLLKLLTLFATSFHVFLPTAKRIRRAVQEDSEYLCDLSVLQKTGDGARAEYIAVIIDVAERNLRDDCRDTDLLSAVSASGAFILERYRNMQNRGNVKNAFAGLLPMFLLTAAVNFALMSVVGVPNISNPGVDIADDFTRAALCGYFGLDDPEELTEAHMAAVYSLAYIVDDHRELLGEDTDMKFTRRCVINEGLYFTPDGYLAPNRPGEGSQASYSVLPDAVRADAFDAALYPVSLYEMAEDVPCAAYLDVYRLRDDVTDAELAGHLGDVRTSDEYAVFRLGNREADLRDLTLFTGLRTLILSDVLHPVGYELDGETGFAVVRL
ncbi:MAG: M56 family metallopeptidase [Clostridia bacterium]|nr:M56 family metallopeptidase [Clostridia bacterium]